MARRKPPTTHGLAVVDKPAGVTSHDVVGMLRRRFDERQVGHAGTLDPDATGVLLVGVGKATRLLRFLTALGKTYTAEVVLGVVDVDARRRRARSPAPTTWPASPSTWPELAAAEHLTGPIMQIPPMVSAVQGRRQAPARAGPRGHRGRARAAAGDGVPFDVDATDDPSVLRIEVGARRARTSARWPPTSVACSAAAPTCATCAAPPSAASAADEALPPDECVLLSPVEAVRDYPRVEVDEPTARHGPPRPGPRSLRRRRTVGGRRPCRRRCSPSTNRSVPRPSRRS